MVFPFDNANSQDTNVLWDFRQFYVEWVRTYIVNFTKSHFENDYVKMRSALSKWHSIIWGRAIKNYEKETVDDSTFGDIMKRIDELACKETHKQTYFGKDRKPIAVADFDDLIRESVVYIVWLMKKHKLFGSDTINRGLT